MNPHKPVETNLAKIAQYGEDRLEENFQFRALLKGQDSDKVDAIVHQLNSEISNQIDCTSCGNCCKMMKPSVTEKDVDRLAKKLEIPAAEVRDKYVERDGHTDYFKDAPCRFLKDKKCTIYEDRPDDCRSFPHLHKDNFSSRMFQVISNYSTCPIVYNVVERLKERLNFQVN